MDEPEDVPDRSDCFITAEELREIAELITTLNTLGGGFNAISYDVALADSNGDDLGHITIGDDSYAFIPTGFRS